MFSPERSLPTPAAEDFGFPYTPYVIQEQLMQQLFQVLEHKQIGIFESPTGTGKSLTLTCAALTWQQQHEELVRAELRQRIQQVETELLQLQAEGAQANDWLTAQGNARTQRQELQQLQKLWTLLQQQQEQLEQLKLRQQQQRPARCASESEAATVAETENDTEADAVQEVERFRDVQIFYCSRTHSQLAQIVAELHKTPHGRSVRCVSLASRKQLCINKQVRRLPSQALINERCLDMGKSKSQPGRCSYKKSATQLQQLSDAALSVPLDIEELSQKGEACGSCPYYATRAAQAQAQLVLLPYALLLQRSSRQQLGIDLRGSIIIVDEAHNLLDTLAQLHSSELCHSQLQLANQQLIGYKQRYIQRLSSGNLLRINQLIFIVRRLLQLLKMAAGKEPRMLRTFELTAEGDFFNIDIAELLQFCERSRFAQKLHGFALFLEREPPSSENQPPAVQQLLQRLQREQQQAGGNKRKQMLEEEEKQQQQYKEKEQQDQVLSTQPSPSPIRPLLAFLDTLTSNAADGRILLNAQAGTLKYLLLNPAEHFDDIINQARALIIAGGTMQPTHELTAQLFARCPERVVEHFYNHVVPPDAVLPFVLPTGPTGASLCFSYAQRNNSAMLKELTMVLQNLCIVLPGGVVCFLPSYDYLDRVYGHLEQSGALQRIGQRKRIFREAAGTGNGSGSVEQLLQQYAEAIAQPGGGGALLLSVVGGKLSEGLNFADDLGRGVIVVGLPYPNRTSPELKERMRHLDETLGNGAGNEYYENLCMKAVNQCIGRSVRHINDYACVYLLDERYGSARIQQKLPAWIGRHLIVASDGFGTVQALTARFFKARVKTT